MENNTWRKTPSNLLLLIASQKSYLLSTIILFNYEVTNLNKIITTAQKKLLHEAKAIESYKCNRR
jgi:hypothetical protein